MSGDIVPYIDLVTSEYQDSVDYIAFISIFLQAMADGQLVSADLTGVTFDLDQAVGVQLDIDGLWIGVSRYLQTPITGVYFTFNTGPGFDKGIFKGPFDPGTSVVRLPDDYYRLVLKAKAAANQWDGTIPGAYRAYDVLFMGTPYSILIYDWQDMSMSVALLGAQPDDLTLALFLGGFLNLKPGGVRIRDYIYPATPGPVFAFDHPIGSLTAGFDEGAFAITVPGS